MSAGSPSLSKKGPLLALKDIQKSFGAVRALRGVSFDLHPGEVHALLGENGAGKSTLIKTITGAHQPDAGVILVDGTEVARMSPREAHRHGIAVIYQQPALFPHLTVAENIALALEPVTALRRIDWKQRGERAAQLLAEAGARFSPEATVSELSMPEQQLVEIAKALGAGARVLILDEPTASLTENESAALLKTVRGLRARGVGIVYISHRLAEIFEIADRVTVLRDGESVGTSLVSAMDEASLIRLMVGREVSTIYPPHAGEAHATSATPVLVVLNLSCAESRVSDVSFELRPGEILGFSGLVGAGRTELARTLFGLTPATSGMIMLAGKPVRISCPQDAMALGIAYVPEDRRRHGVISEMSVAANISMASHKKLFPKGWLRSTAERDLAEGFRAKLGIKAASIDALVATLSGGNAQKVAVARWLATGPAVLILDEPTQGVDIGAKAEIHKLIRNLAEEGLAVIMISSDLPEIIGMSDRVAIMREGRIATILQKNEADAHAIMAAALGRS